MNKFTINKDKFDFDFNLDSLGFFVSAVDHDLLSFDIQQSQWKRRKLNQQKTADFPLLSM